MRAKSLKPKYSKSIHSFCSNPDYGCVLAPELEALFAQTPAPQEKPRKKANRRKPDQYTFRLTPEDTEKFNEARAYYRHDMQSAAEFAVALYIEKAALEAGTSKTADVNITTESITESEADVNV